MSAPKTATTVGQLLEHLTAERDRLAMALAASTPFVRR
jgi:hypothetical protein